MRNRGRKTAIIFAAFCALLFTALPRTLIAQVVTETTNPTSDTLDIRGSKAATWSGGGANVISLQGTVVITADRTRITADSAVIWLSPIPGSVLDEQQADIALIGNASLQQQDVTRSGDQLFVTINVRGKILLTTDERLTQDQSDSPLYHDAALLRPADRFSARFGAGGE